MARPLRIEFPGAVHHVTTRGNARANIFDDDDDRRIFLAILGQTVRRFNWICHAWCLMDNHYHLLIETPDGNLSQGMRHLNGVYTQSYNRLNQKEGHLFKGRFKSVLVEKDSHLLELCRYVVLNPVRAGIVERPELYPWSSYLFTLGEKPAPPYLTTAWILSRFSPSPSKARKLYRQFVEDGMKLGESPWEKVSGQVILGSMSFVEEIRSRFAGQLSAGEFSRNQRFLGRPPLSQLFPPDLSIEREERNRLIRTAHLDHGYTLAEIARAAGIHYSTVSKVVNAEK